MLAMYAVARARRLSRERGFAMYVADSLQLIPQGKYMARTLSDMFDPAPEIDADAVISRVEAMLGGEL